MLLTYHGIINRSLDGGGDGGGGTLSILFFSFDLTFYKK